MCQLFLERDRLTRLLLRRVRKLTLLAWVSFKPQKTQKGTKVKSDALNVVELSKEFRCFDFAQHPILESLDTRYSNNFMNFKNF